jgi:hypothetical protein
MTLPAVCCSQSLSSHLHFTTYPLLTHPTDAWCTIEMCTAVIVVSLPGLKSLIVRATPQNTKERSSNGYQRTPSRQPYGNRSFVSRGDPEPFRGDDEQELVTYNQHSHSFLNRSINETGPPSAKNAVMVTTNLTVTRSLPDTINEAASSISSASQVKL